MSWRIWDETLGHWVNEQEAQLLAEEYLASDFDVPAWRGSMHEAVEIVASLGACSHKFRIVRR